MTVYYYASRLFDQKINYIYNYFVCSCLLTRVCVCVRHTSWPIVTLLPQVRRQRLAEGRWVKCWWQPKVQTGFKQTWLQEKMWYVIHWMIIYHSYEITLFSMILKDKMFNQGWQTCLRILKEHVGNSIHICKGDIMVYFCGFLGSEVANNFTAEQLLVCGCQRCTHLNISLFALSQSRFDLQLGAPGWCGVLQKNNAWQRMKVERLQYHKALHLLPQFSPGQHAQFEIPWKPSYLMLALGAGTVWWQVNRL